MEIHKYTANELMDALAQSNVQVYGISAICVSRGTIVPKSNFQNAQRFTLPQCCSSEIELGLTEKYNADHITFFDL
jgi:hypothetical protein